MMVSFTSVAGRSMPQSRFSAAWPIRTRARLRSPFANRHRAANPSRERRSVGVAEPRIRLCSRADPDSILVPSAYRLHSQAFQHRAGQVRRKGFDDRSAYSRWIAHKGVGQAAGFRVALGDRALSVVPRRVLCVDSKTGPREGLYSSSPCRKTVVAASSAATPR